MSDEIFQKDLTNKLSKLCGIIPVGTPWMGFDLKSKPLGVQLYQGQLLDRNTYAVHYSWIQDHRTIVSDEEWNAYAESHNGMCPYFSYGNNTNTYRMPKIVNVHPKFTNSNDAGNYVEAGLPNITGWWKASWNQPNRGFHGLTAGGCFYDSYPSYDAVGRIQGVDSNNSATRGYPWFDASRSNAIYGNSDTVQPPAINMLIGEYVFSTIGKITKSTEDIVISNIEKIEWLESIQEAYVKKSDVSSYVVETWISETSWYRKYSDGWIEQGGIVTSVPSGGYKDVTLHTAFSNTNYLAFIINTGSYYGQGQANDTVLRQSNTTIRVHSGSHLNNNFAWYACGY